MNYFIKDITTYRPANKKCAEIVEFVEKYKDGLIYDKVSRDEFVTEIRRKVEILNNTYPRPKRLVVNDGGYEQVSCYPEGRGADYEYVFTIRISPVKIYIGFPTQCVNCTSFNR